MTPGDIPLMPRGVRLHECKLRKGWFLLAPERAVKLDQIGIAILGCVDGARDLSSITAKLAQDYNAPPDRIGADVAKFLTGLIDRRMVDLK